MSNLTGVKSISIHKILRCFRNKNAKKFQNWVLLGVTYINAIDLIVYIDQKLPQNHGKLIESKFEGVHSMP